MGVLNSPRTRLEDLEKADFLPPASAVSAAEQDPPQKVQGRKSCTVRVTAVICIITTAALGLTFALQFDGGFGPNLDLSSVACFDTTDELRQAVSAYMDDSSKEAWDSTEYGWPINEWCVGQIKDFSNLFRNTTFNEALDKWDMSSATNTSGMFHDAYTFHQSLNSWDVSSVVDMSGMFENARLFNGDIRSWKVSSVRSMASMFEFAMSFQGDLSAWDVSNVEDMSSMFASAVRFDADISKWDVSRVKLARFMFYTARDFNQDLSGWHLVSAQKLGAMFASAVSFNFDLCDWGDILGDTAPSVPGMFSHTACPTTWEPDLSGEKKGPFCHECS